MYSIHSPKDRIFICFIICLLLSWVVRTIIVSGNGGPYSWRIRTSTYQLSELQNFAAYGLTVLSLMFLFIMIISSIQIAFQWFRNHNSI